MSYRGYGLAWLLVWLLAAPACATGLSVGDLKLTVSAPWQRGSADEENDFDSVVLRQSMGPSILEVFLPKYRARPKTDAQQFFEHLEKSWRRRYGEDAQFDWLESGGMRWRVCKRPSRSGDGQVYQIVTVHGGEVYQVVAIVPPQTGNLPEAVKTLLASTTWDGATASGDQVAHAPVPVSSAPVENAVVAQAEAPASAPVPAPVPVSAPVPAPAPAPVSVPAPASASAPLSAPTPAPVPAPAPPPLPSATEPTDVAPAPAPAAGGKWRLLRSVVVAPGARSWPKLADAEVALLGPDGLVTGLGLAQQAYGLDGFLEGSLWRKGADGVESRQPFRRHWYVNWPAPLDSWVGGDVVNFSLDLLVESEGMDVSRNMTARFDVSSACMPRLDMVRWLDDLERNGPVGFEKLSEMACEPQAESVAPVTVTLVPAQHVGDPQTRAVEHVPIPLPLAWEQGIRTTANGAVRRIVLTVHLVPDAAPGSAMFGQALAVFVFGPDV